jgi:hypothetical protein
VWEPIVDVYYVADPPTAHVPLAKVGLPAVPDKWEPLENVKPVDLGPAGLKRVKQLMGDQGLVGIWAASTCALTNEQEIFDYDAADGGRFILSTGDQCGRDTPDENLRAMVETARTYGGY